MIFPEYVNCNSIYFSHYHLQSWPSCKSFLDINLWTVSTTGDSACPQLATLDDRRLCLPQHTTLDDRRLCLTQTHGSWRQTTLLPTSCSWIAILVDSCSAWLSNSLHLFWRLQMMNGDYFQPDRSMKGLIVLTMCRWYVHDHQIG